MDVRAEQQWKLSQQILRAEMILNTNLLQSQHLMYMQQSMVPDDAAIYVDYLLGES